MKNITVSIEKTRFKEERKCEYEPDVTTKTVLVRCNDVVFRSPYFIRNKKAYYIDPFSDKRVEFWRFGYEFRIENWNVFVRNNWLQPLFLEIVYYLDGSLVTSTYTIEPLDELVVELPNSPSVGIKLLGPNNELLEEKIVGKPGLVWSVKKMRNVRKLTMAGTNKKGTVYVLCNNKTIKTIKEEEVILGTFTCSKPLKLVRQVDNEFIILDEV